MLKEVKVKIARPTNRPLQLRYVDPVEGREIRLSTGTYDENEAERQRKKKEAELLCRIRRSTTNPDMIVGPQMRWEDFREKYSEQLSVSAPRSADDTESRLDIAQRILKPRVLADVANAEALHRLRAQLRAGACHRVDQDGRDQDGRPRSPHTVKSYMAAVMAALNWAAEFQGWLESVPKFRKIKTSKLKAMKGRPLTDDECERMLAAVEAGVLNVPIYKRQQGGKKPTRPLTGKALAEYRQKREAIAARVADSWRHVLRGLLVSGLRLDELMHVSWDDLNCIVPQWRPAGIPCSASRRPCRRTTRRRRYRCRPSSRSCYWKRPKINVTAGYSTRCR